MWTADGATPCTTVRERLPVSVSMVTRPGYGGAALPRVWGNLVSLDGDQCPQAGVGAAKRFHQLLKRSRACRYLLTRRRACSKSGSKSTRFVEIQIKIRTSLRRNTEVRLTRRWREMDSNVKFRAKIGNAFVIGDASDRSLACNPSSTGHAPTIAQTTSASRCSVISARGGSRSAMGNCMRHPDPGS
jgi:hypothetical protein